MSTAQKIEVGTMKHSTETRIALLEQSIGHLDETLLRIDRKIDIRFDEMEKKFSKIDQQLEKFNDRIWANFYWILGSLFTLTSLMCGVMAKGFGWFN